MGDNVRQSCELLALYAPALPFVGEFLADLHAFQALVYPILGISQPFVIGHCLLDGHFGVLHLVQTVAGDLRHPLFERFGLRRGDRLNQAEKLCRVRHVGKTHLSVGSQHFQTVTICHGFISLRFKSLFEFTPIGGGICTFGQNCDNIDNRKIPFLGFVVPDGPHLAFLEKLYSLFLGHLFVTYRLMLYDMNNNIFRFLERLLKCINITYDP